MSDASPRLTPARFLALTCVIALLYFLTARLGFLAAIPPGNVTIVWPPSGLAVAAIILLGRRGLPGIWLGSFVANLFSLSSIIAPLPALLSATLIATGSTLQAGMITWLRQRWVPHPHAIPRIRDLLGFFRATALGCLIAASVGTGSLLLAGLIQPVALSFTWLTWWLGDLLGIAIFTPLLLLFGKMILKRNKPLSGQLGPVVAALGFGVSTYFLIIIWSQETRALQQRLQQDTQAIVAQLSTTINSGFADLDSLSNLYIIKPDLSRAEFRQFAGHEWQRAPATPGLQLLAWVPHVTDDTLDQLLARARQDGLAGFELQTPTTDASVGHANANHEHLPIYYVEPFAEHAQLLGLDLQADPQLRKLLAAAAAQAEAVVMPPSDLRHLGGTDCSLLIAYPVYDLGATTNERQLAGFFVGLYTVPALFDRALEAVSLQQITVSAVIESEVTYTHEINQPASPLIPLQDPLTYSQSGLTASLPVSFGSTEWQIVTRATPAYIAANRTWLPWQVFGTGLLFTILAVLFVLQRQHSSQALRERQLRLQLILDTAFDAAIGMDEQGRIIDWNPAAEAMFGWKRNEVLGQPLAELLIPDHLRTAHLHSMNLFHREGRFERQLDLAELVAQRRNGEIFPVEISVRPLQLQQRILFNAFIRDITARKHAEAALRESEQRFRHLIENSHDLIQSVATDGHFLFVNHAWLQTLAYSEHELSQLTIWDIVHPDSREQCLVEFERLLAGQESARVQPIFVSRSGAVIETDGIVVTRKVDGRVVATNTFLRDVTEQRKTERIQEIQHAVNRILARSPELDQALPDVLEAIARGLNWQLAELWLRESASEQPGWHTSWHTPEMGGLAEVIAQRRGLALAAGQDLAGVVLTRGEAAWIEVVVAEQRPLLEATGLHVAAEVPILIGAEVFGIMTFSGSSTQPVDPHVLAVLADLGRQIGQFVARKQAEQALRAERATLAERVEARTADLSRMNAELARMARAKDEFLASMSHELRTPLTGVLGLAESLIEGIYGNLTQPQVQAINTIETSGRHLLSLINDVLDVAKIEAGKVELQRDIFLIDDICQSSLILIREMAIKKQLQIEYLNDHRQARIEADPRRLKQILVNLLSNAVKFTQRGGKIRLEVGFDPAQSQVAFRVEDSGIGIRTEDMARLFRPFVQLDSRLSRQHEGTGLGLVLVHRLTELHGGSVMLRSDGIPGKGACFTVTLPWQQSIAEKSLVDLLEEPQIQLPPASSTLDAVILLVDDNEVNLQTLGDYLKHLNYHLVVARNGEEAIERARAVRPDLILMDIQMPLLDGLSATRRLRTDPRFSEIPIVALTALAMPGDRERCLQAGATDYLTKPVSLQRCAELVEQLLRDTATHNPSSIN